MNFLWLILLTIACVFCSSMPLLTLINLILAKINCNKFKNTITFRKVAIFVLLGE